MRKIDRNVFLGGCALCAAVAIAYAAAGQGFKWSASTTYDDGSQIEASKKVVYLGFNSADGKQVFSTTDLSIAASKLPADGCYYLMGAILNDTGTGVVPGSIGAPTETKCTTARPTPPPVQKKVAKPLNFDIVP